MDTDGDILQRKRCLFFQGVEGEFTIDFSVPEDTSFVERYALWTGNGCSFGMLPGMKGKMYFLGVDDAHTYFGFCHNDTSL